MPCTLYVLPCNLDLLKPVRKMTQHIPVFLMLVLLVLSIPVSAQDTPYGALIDEADAEALAPLNDYLQQAATSNSQLQAQYQAVVAQSHQRAQVGALPDPEVNLAFFANPPNQEGSLPGRFAVSAMQMFPWFGTRTARRTAADHRTRAQEQQFEAAWLDLMRDVQTAYFDYYRAQRTVELTEQQIELLDDLEPIIRTRYETGRASGGQVDLLRIEMEQEELRSELETLRDERAPIKARFNALLDRAPDASIEIPEGLPDTDLQLADRTVPPDTDALIDIVLNRNPTLDRFDAQEDAFRADAEVARHEGYPRIGLGVEVMGRDFMQMRTMDRMNEGVALMATIQVPLFRAPYRARQQQAHAERRRVQQERQQLARDLRADVEREVQAYQAAMRRVTLHREELLPRSAQALQILQEDYTAGRTPFDEIIRMQRQMLDYALAIVEAQTDQHQARVEIETLARSPDRPAPDFTP